MLNKAYFIQKIYGRLFIIFIRFAALIISEIIDVPSSPKDICYAKSFSKFVFLPTVLNDKYNVGLTSDSLAARLRK